MFKTECPVLTLETEKRERNTEGTVGNRAEEPVFFKRSDGEAYLFPLLSRSMAFPSSLDLVSSSCTSSSNVFLQVCLALCHKEKTIRT